MYVCEFSCCFNVQFVFLSAFSHTLLSADLYFAVFLNCFHSFLSLFGFSRSLLYCFSCIFNCFPHFWVSADLYFAFFLLAYRFQLYLYFSCLVLLFVSFLFFCLYFGFNRYLLCCFSYRFHLVSSLLGFSRSLLWVFPCCFHVLFAFFSLIYVSVSVDRYFVVVF